MDIEFQYQYLMEMTKYLVDDRTIIDFLTQLHSINFNLDASQAKEIAEAFNVNLSVTTLDLTDICLFTNISFSKDIAAALKVNKTLQTLKLFTVNNEVRRSQKR